MKKLKEVPRKYERLGEPMCLVSLCVGDNHAYGGDTAIEVGGGIKVPAKGGSASTSVMVPVFSLPFASGDKGGK
jgi:hypothetical protein